MSKKHREILDALHGQIVSGHYAAGGRMPSENELALRFQVSRPTAARALRELWHMGLVERRVGSGTFVRQPAAPTVAAPTFGLLVPGLGNTEILDPICNEITRTAQAGGATVLWGDASAVASGAAEAERLCAYYVERAVAGVFFAPLESLPDREAVNLRIVRALQAAGIAVVLLDREALNFPGRIGLDLVGVDNFAAGYALADHLLRLGHRTFRLLGRPMFPSSTELRFAGCRAAMLRHGVAPPADWNVVGNPADADFARALLTPQTPDAIVCSNDLAAARLMQSLSVAGRRVPADVAVVGFDDVTYSTLLAVPLTTVRQPCRAIAAAAVDAMTARLRQPDAAPRQILLTGELMVRRSCGASGPLSRVATGEG